MPRPIATARRRRGICPVIPYKSNARQPAGVLSENALQGTGTNRAGGRQTQTIQAHRAPMREDRMQLWLFRRARSRLHLDQIRPHDLGCALTGRRQGRCAQEATTEASSALALPSPASKRPPLQPLLIIAEPPALSTATPSSSRTRQYASRASTPPIQRDIQQLFLPHFSRLRP